MSSVCGDRLLVISDASPLRYLTAVGEIRHLQVIFGQISVPIAVRGELTASSTPAAVRSFIESSPGWLTFHNPKPHFLEAIHPGLDRGEREALALAIQMKADLVLIDDAAGRREAKHLGIRVTGTAGVLALAAERKLVDFADVISRLRQAGFYIDQKVLDKAFAKWL